MLPVITVERTSKPQSALRLLQCMVHKGLLRKRKVCTIPTLRELVMRKQLKGRQDQMSTHGASLKKQSGRGMDHEQSIKVSRATDYPGNPVAYPPNDDIFGDLPLLESSKSMFHTGVDILPTIIEDSFVENQNGPDAISETESLKLMPIADVSKQTSPPLEDLVKKEQSPDKESTCMFPNDAGGSHSSSAEFGGLLNHTSVTMAKTCLPEMQLQSTHVPALSSDCDKGSKSGSSNRPQGCFYTNTNCFQEMKKPGTSSAVVSARTEAMTKDRDAATHGLNHTSVTMEKTSLPEMQLKSTHVPALSSCCNEGAKSSSSNSPQGCFYSSTNFFQEMKKTGSSSMAVSTRSEVITKDRDAAIHGLNRTGVTMVKTSLPERQMKSTHVPALSSYCNEGEKSGSSNRPQGCFYTNTNYFQEMRRAGTSSVSVRTRTEAITKDRDAAIHGLNHASITMAKTSLPEMQLKSTHVPALNYYRNEGAKSGSSNRPQGFYTNTNHFQEMRRPGTSSVAVRTRTEAIKADTYAAVHGKKSTGISGRVIPTEYHSSCEGSLLSLDTSQRNVNAGINTNGMSSCRSMPGQDYVPASSPCKVASNVYYENRKSLNSCTTLSMDDQGSRYAKSYPGHSLASISSPFMKIPGLEKMEISSYDPRRRESRFVNERSLNPIRCQQQKQVSGMTSTIEGQNKIGYNDSQAGKRGPDGFVMRNNCDSDQPTMRLMGKTVSLCKGSMEQEVPTTRKMWIDKNIIEEDRPSSVSCHLTPERRFPYQHSVIPGTLVHESSDTLPRIPRSTVAQARPVVSNARNHRLQQANIVSSAVKDCTWNSGSQFDLQAQVNKESMIGNSRTRHLDLSPRNQYFQSNPAPSMYAEDRTFIGSVVNQSSPFPQWSSNTSMQRKYQNPTSLAYEDPRSVPTHQPCQVPGANQFSTSVISFHDYGTKNAESRNSYQRAHPSLSTSAASKFHDYCTKNSEYRSSYQGAYPSLSASVASKSISTISPTCTRDVFNTDGRNGVSLIDERGKRRGCADNVSQQPAKRQLVADKPESTTSMFPSMEKYSFGWSLNDAVGPRMLDFSNKIAGQTTQISKNGNTNLGENSVPAVESRSKIVKAWLQEHRPR